MKKPILYPIDEVFNYINLNPAPKLTTDIKTQVLIIGGGMAGLSAAQTFNENGFEVTLIEKNFCGAGASGKSSGFITPDSELDLTDLSKEFGTKKAKQLWEFVKSGVDLIHDNINKYKIECDYLNEDTLIVAASKKDFSEIKEEHEIRKKLNYTSHLYHKEDLKEIIGSRKFFGGLRYPSTFGINAYKYCQCMKEVLIKKGVQIFEDTPATEIHAKSVHTPSGKIHADYIVVCVDRFLPELEKELNPYIFHAQTFLLISQPLSDIEIKKIFPKKPMLTWDTSIIYQYFRITNDNRLMLGGSDLISIFWGKEQHNLNRMYKKLKKYADKHFPGIDLNFEYFWPGLIGTTRDIMPLATIIPKKPHVYYISGAAGLPWASALGRLSFERLINNNTDFDEFFTQKRKYTLGNWFQAIFGKRITFAISNLIRLYK
jgi:gamma-glutamylputrescine oxidase